MNRKQLSTVVFLLVVFGVVAILISRHRNEGAESGETGIGGKLLGDKFPVNDVLHIFIKGPTNELNLVKKDEAWRVAERGNYPANFAQLGEFLVKLSDLKVVQNEEIGPSQLGRLQLMDSGHGSNSATILKLEGKDDKVMKSLFIGKQHVHKETGGQPSPFGGEGFPDGRYVMAENDRKQVLLVGDPLNNAEPRPESWLYEDFFRVDKARTIAVTYPADPTNSWKLSRATESAAWTLDDAKKDELLDVSKISGITSPFASPSFNDVLYPTGKPEDHGFDKPTLINIETFDNFSYAVKVGKKSDEEFPVQVAVTANLPKERTPAKDEKPEDKEKADKAWAAQQKPLVDKLKREQAFGQWTYLMPAWNVESLLKDRKDLLAEKKEEPKKDGKTAGTNDKKDDLAPPDLIAAPPADKKP